MAIKVNPPKRRYDSVIRQEGARRTRATILKAARHLFLVRGYAATTIGSIADEAGVVVDTLYAVVGRKPELFRLLIETAISGEDAPVGSEDRAYVKEIRSATGARRKLQIYVAALLTIHPRLAPLFLVLRGAASSDPALAKLWKEISERRARMMQRFAADLIETGEVRPELGADVVADILWSMNAPEYYILLVHERRWSLDRFGSWLVDAWSRLLLKPDSIGRPRDSS